MNNRTRPMLSAAVALSILAGPGHAGEAENIVACAEAVEVHSGQLVDEFDVVYDGAFLGFSVAKWSGIVCEVSLASVWSLNVGGKQLIIEGFSGQEAKAAYERLALKTEEAVAVLQSRQNILKRRLNDAEAKLRSPNPDVGAITGHVEEGVRKATGR